MGAVSVDIHRRERDFQNLTLSDTEVVRYLIIYRSKIDSSYSATMNLNVGQAGEIFDLNQELIALYASLDKVIEQCDFKEKQIKLVELLFEGNTMTDILRMNIGYKRSATYDLFDRIVAKIVSTNNENWRKTMEINGYIK